MIKCECVCSKCKEVIPAYQGVDGQVVPGMLIFDFLNKNIKYLCPQCGHQNTLELGSVDKAVKERERLPRISSSKF